MSSLILTNLGIINPILNHEQIYQNQNPNDPNSTVPLEPVWSTLGMTRASNQLGFTSISTGLSSSGDYNYVALGDFNNDGDIDIASGAEDYSSANTVGLKAYTGNGGTSWSSRATGLWTGNAWGGLALADTDGDGYVELYASDEHWGTSNNSGLKAWEFRSNRWIDSASFVSTPCRSGTPDNVIITDITGDTKLDMLICNRSGLDYYQNNGGNPVKWSERSSGLSSSAEFTAAMIMDMNKDGLKDIVTTDYSGGEHLYIQSKTGNLWSQYSTGLSISGNCLGVALGDVNCDSHMDIIFGRRDDGLVCLLGNSGGISGTSFSWTAANTGLPTSWNSGRYCQIQLVDIDLDGDLDLIAPEARNGYGIQIYLGNGSKNPGKNIGWTKASNTNLPTAGYWYGANIYDINKDGSTDIVGASWGNGIRAWLNNMSNVDNIPPGDIIDLAVINTTITSININWTAPADNGTDMSSGPVNSYDIRYSTNPITMFNWGMSTKCSNPPTPMTPGSDQIFNITGLAPNATYYIAIRSSDEVPNNSSISNVVNIKTKAIIDTNPPGAVVDLQITNFTISTITINWTAPADNGTDMSSGPVLNYDIRYSQNPLTISNWASAIKCIGEPEPEEPGTQQGFKITNLAQNTTYYIGLRSRDERPNYSMLSNIVNTKTDPIIDTSPPGAVTDLHATNMTISTITINWTAPADNGTDMSSGPVLNYDIRYSQNPLTISNWASAIKCIGEPEPEPPGTQQSFKLTDLAQNTTYYIGLRSRDERPSYSALSNIIINTTKPVIDIIPPGAITDLHITNITNCSITINWSAPCNNDTNISSGPVLNYDIRYSTGPLTISNWTFATKCIGEPEPSTPGTQQSYKVTGLEPDTVYYIALRSRDHRPNKSPLSNILLNSTHPNLDLTPPDPVSDLAITNTTSYNVTVNWTAPADNGSDITSGPVTSYDIRYSKTEITGLTWKNANKCLNEPVPSQPGIQDGFKITGLAPGTLYYFALRSLDERPNISPISNVIMCSTLGLVDTVEPGRITDLLAANPTNYSINLTWTATADNGSNVSSGPVVDYDIRYYTSPINNTTWPLATKCTIPISPGSPGSTEHYMVTGLIGETTYYFAIKARDERPNWGMLSNIPFDTTLVDPDITPPGTIIDLVAYGPTYTSINLTWTATGDDGNSGNASYYDIRYSRSPITTVNWATAAQCSNEPTPKSNGVTEYYQITGLLPGIEYYFAIKIGDEIPHWSGISNIAVNRTIPIPDTTPPDQVKDLHAMDPTNNSVNLTWTAPADNGSDISSGPVTHYDIRYSTSPITNTTWDMAIKCSKIKAPGTPGALEIYTVTGLTAETQYYFAIKACDENSNWAWISNCPFNITLPNPDIIPPSAVADLNATDPTQTTINLTWTAMGDDGDLGNASYYDIRYSRSPITTLNWASAVQCPNEPAPDSFGTKQYYQVTALEPGMRYYFAIKVGDEVPLWSHLSNIAWNYTIQIPDTTPPGQILDLWAGDTTNYSINLTWTAPADNRSDPNSGPVDKYEIRYSRSPITNVTWSMATNYTIQIKPGEPGVFEKVVITGLNPETQYYFAVKACDENSNWGWLSNCPFNITLKDPDIIPPCRIIDLSATNPTQTTIDLTWTATGDDGNWGNASYYDIRYSKSPITTLTWASANICNNAPEPKANGIKETYQVSGLDPNEKYYFAVKVGDEVPQWSSISNIAWNITLKVPDTTPPTKIYDLTIVETTRSTVTLTWTAVGDDGLVGNATSYSICYGLELINLDNWVNMTSVQDTPTPKPSGETETFEIVELESNTTYYFAIRVSDEVPNWSPVSNCPNVNTRKSPKSELGLSVVPEKNELNSTESFNIEIQVFNNENGQSVPFAYVSLTSNGFALRLDPAEGKGETDAQGIFIITITTPEVAYITVVTIYIQVLKENFTSNKTSIKIIINPPEKTPSNDTEKSFNLYIDEDEVTFSKSTIHADEEVKIYAVVTNIGQYDAPAFYISFYIDGIQLEDSMIISGLQVDSFVLIEIPWIPESGNHSIKIFVTPTNQYLESDTTDNSAEILVGVIEIQEPVIDPIDNNNDNEKNNNSDNSSNNSNNSNNGTVDDEKDKEDGNGNGNGDDDDEPVGPSPDVNENKDKEGDTKEQDWFEILLSYDILIIIIIFVIIIFILFIQVVYRRSKGATGAGSIEVTPIPIDVVLTEDEPLEVEPIAIEVEPLSDVQLEDLSDKYFEPQDPILFKYEITQEEFPIIKITNIEDESELEEAIIISNDHELNNINNI